LVKVKDVADITKLKKTFNIEFTGLEEGLKKTVEDYLRKLNLRKSGNA